MKICAPVSALILALNTLVFPASAVDEPKPYGRVCLAVLDSSTKSEVSLSEATKPGPAHSVIAHLDANADCEAVIAAFSRATGELANGWRPVLLSLKEWDEQTAPATDESWAWLQPTAPFEVFVAFLPKGASGYEKVRDLVASLRDPQTDPAVAKLQARQLREELMKWSADDKATATRPGSAPATLGGTVRDVATFPWRNEARKLNFSETKPSVTVFRHAGK